ncbi:MAG: ribbon-helix-helix protein, CopG family [Deltaproteobacteria bacterium]|nr:ribbon-helix-helix protein, CopG family [Deltaproteobacteria bacterium]
MHTTLTIDDDLLDQVKRQALELGLTVSEVVNRALRRGLSAESVPTQGSITLTWGDPHAATPDWAGPSEQLRREDDEWLRRKAAL